MVFLIIKFWIVSAINNLLNGIPLYIYALKLKLLAQGKEKYKVKMINVSVNKATI
jgi:hypothetical protein